MAGSYYQGRFGRKQFVFNLFFSMFAAMAVVVGWGLWISDDGRIPDGAGLAFVIIVFLFHTVVVVRRLHDLDRSGWQIWFFLVPLFNIYLVALLFFQRGTEGPNRFGHDPLL